MGRSLKNCGTIHYSCRRNAATRGVRETTAVSTDEIPDGPTMDSSTNFQAPPQAAYFL